MAMDGVTTLLRPVAEALDSLGVAMCVFDDDDNTLLWNRRFLEYFPEHAGHVHVGEPYRDNLRRFYAERLAADEHTRLEQYVDAGIARHRAQQRPYGFDHRGRQLTVASLPLPGIGRVRFWRPEAAAPGAGDDPAPLAGALDGTELFDHLAEGIMVEVGGRIAYVNQPFATIYGLPDRRAALGASFESIYRAAWAGHMAGPDARRDQGFDVLADNLRFPGAPFELPLPEERWSRVIAERRTRGRVYSVHGDISPLKRRQHQLADAERRARASEAELRRKTALLEVTLERMEQGVMMVTRDRVVEVCNRRAIELLGLPPELMARRPRFDDVLAAQWAAGEFAEAPPEVQAFVRGGGILDRPHCYDRRRPDGRVIEIHSVPIEGGGVLRTYTDVTERRRSEQRMRHVASHDGLTELANREEFAEQLAAALADGAARAAGVALHFIDLDRFKPVNDRLGHAVGDRVLAVVAQRLRGVARDGDLAARLGGDEFAILQRGVPDTEAALSLARRVIEALERPIHVEQHEVQVSASVGVALAGDGAGQDPTELLRRADAAMYAAKADGRQVSLDEPLSAQQKSN